MKLKKSAIFAGKLAAKTALFAGELGIKFVQEAAKNAINKGATPPPDYDPDAGNGLAKKFSEWNKKIHLFDDPISQLEYKRRDLLDQEKETDDDEERESLSNEIKEIEAQIKELKELKAKNNK